MKNYLFGLERHQDTQIKKLYMWTPFNKQLKIYLLHTTQMQVIIVYRLSAGSVQPQSHPLVLVASIYVDV